MEYPSPLKQSAKYGAGVALGTLIYQLTISEGYALDIYRPIFVGILSTIFLYILFRRNNKN
ncbi:hypothetical protein [Neptunicella sp. SCSIO 80796]|uniref:hypothetical protein n=1 Tax=Neptunicella plasticusilytica TaxID=3117012 RepID=UPI003A4D7169